MKIAWLSTLAAAALVTLSLGLEGCTSGTRSDAPGGATALAAEAPPDGAAVFLRGREDFFSPNRVIVDVVARGAVDLHGAAFRMTWDPDALTFVAAQGGSAWSKQSLAMAKESLPGQLVVAWSEKGEMAIDATHETVLGTLTFEVRNHRSSSLAFKTERSQLVDKKGAKVDAAWRGATIAAR